MKARLGKSYSHANSRLEAWKSIGRFTSCGRAETEMERSLVREEAYEVERLLCAKDAGRAKLRCS
jgi:hypothetical protein